LWFPAIQRIKRKQNPTDLSPKSCFITAKAIEREIWQIGEPQKAAGELDRRDIRVGLGIVPAKDGVNNVTGAWE